MPHPSAGHTPTVRSRVLLISDLHLEESRPALTRGFLDFLQRETPSASALYILGDFFNVWVGDDDDRPLNSEIAGALQRHASQGLAIYLMHGNRDFLLGEKFANAAGARLLPEPWVLDHDGQRYLLLHGDVLCTHDQDYMNFRAMVRNPQWQQAFLARPLTERRTFASQAREQSKSMNSNKAADIMDVTAEEVERLFTSHGISDMIHGHTHRPAVHELSAGGKSCRRIVLGDWGDYGWYVSLEDAAASLRQFPLQAAAG